MTITQLLQKAAKSGASDLHLAVGHRPVLRIDGELQPISTDKVLTAKQIKSLIIPIINESQKKRFVTDYDLDFSFDLKGQRFRVNVHMERGNEALAARVIPKEIPTMDAIGLMETVQELINLPNGLVLVTGPAGVGKSTTLAAMIQAINLANRLHIITLEDPIEFVFPVAESIVKQREIGQDVVSFKGGLRHVLRQDPDVIMVGEMRDLESISSTITLAETGHLVFSTLHTSSASETIQRIIDIFPPQQQTQVRSQLSMSLRAVISQILVPRKDGGLMAAREIMMNTAAIGNMIRESKVEQIPNAIQTGARLGMRTMKQDLIRLVKEGHVDKKDIESFL